MFKKFISSLNRFWSSKACVILQGYDVEKGAATLGPKTFFNALGPEECRIAYVDPCRRPVDSCFAQKNTERYQRFFQYQILLKPAPNRESAQELFFQSLKSIDSSLKDDELKFQPDSWTSPVFGAEGSGWEAWLNGSEIAQLTYFNRMGDVKCRTTPLEITYGLERVFTRLNEIDNFSDIVWSNDVSYGDLFDVAEREHSQYNLKIASMERHAQLIDLYLKECELAISEGLLHPALDFLLKAAHSYNIANNRGGGEEYIGEDTLSNIRTTAKLLAQSYLEDE